MGPDKAVHVLDDALHGSVRAGYLQGARRRAAARSKPDLVLAGAESTDARGQVMPHMLAERLGIAALTGARKLTVDGATLTIERQTEEGYEVVTASTPAIVSVWDTINEPRYPSFKGIMEAKKKPVQTLSPGRPGHRRRRGRLRRGHQRGGRGRQAPGPAGRHQGHRRGRRRRRRSSSSSPPRSSCEGADRHG